MIRIFGKERRILTSDIDTWIVEWKTYKCGFTGNDNYPDVKVCYKAFTNKNEAKEYAKNLNDARKLLGMTALDDAYVYKQEVNSI